MSVIWQQKTHGVLRRQQKANRIIARLLLGVVVVVTVLSAAYLTLVASNVRLARQVWAMEKEMINIQRDNQAINTEVGTAKLHPGFAGALRRLGLSTRKQCRVYVRRRAIMLRGPDERLRLITVFLIAALLPIAGQLVRLQILEHDYYKGEAEQLVHRPYTLPEPPWGIILDRNGDLLIGNTPVYDIGAEVNLVTDTLMSAMVLSPLLNIPEEELIETLTMPAGTDRTSDRIVWRSLAKKIPVESYEKIRGTRLALDHGDAHVAALLRRRRDGCAHPGLHQRRWLGLRRAGFPTALPARRTRLARRLRQPLTQAHCPASL